MEQIQTSDDGVSFRIYAFKQITSVLPSLFSHDPVASSPPIEKGFCCHAFVPTKTEHLLIDCESRISSPGGGAFCRFCFLCQLHNIRPFCLPLHTQPAIGT